MSGAHGNFRCEKAIPFWPSARGLLAWDVDRLVARTRGLVPVEVALTAIRELDEPYWYAVDLAGSAAPTCRSIAEHMRLVCAADLTFPIILDPDGRVLDGMHRVVKAHLQGHTCVRAYRLAALPAPDFVGVDPDDLPYDD